MAQTLFIDIYAFTLKKVKETKKITTPSGGEGERVTTEGETVNISDLIATFEGNEYEDKFKTFLSEFISQFNSGFLISREKGISMNENHHTGISIAKAYIWGEFSGGHTGREQSVFTSTDSTNKEYIISKEKMVASPYFFLIWMPKDLKQGVLIVQRYSNASCTNELKTCISRYFVKRGFKPSWYAYVPKEICKQYLDACILSGVRVQHSAPSKDAITNPLYSDFASDTGVSFATRLSGLALPFSRLRTSGKFKEDFKGFIGIVDKNYKEDDKVTITYTNTEGHPVTASLDNFDEIAPKIALETECFNDATNTPDWDKLPKKAIEFLESIKNEMGYNPPIES